MSKYPSFEELYKYETSNPITRIYIFCKYKIFLDITGGCKVPDSFISSYAQTIFPDIKEFFESPDTIKEYEEWKEKNKNNKVA